ncbi:hypothetical protein GpartN1_g3127.t1 [Galdieria partita]|uniref:Uncharacterized protein n=1 Tax=Galdieria partita TaxID=83374 RepID=A0A9C7UQ67_9RHOD|nr:hypothetical protein GpartN1_g3127.t1 [Galdieria partita]
MRLSKLIFTAAVLAVTNFTNKDDWRLIVLEQMLFTLYMGCSLGLNYVIQRIVEKNHDLSVVQNSTQDSAEIVSMSVEEHDLSVLFRRRILTVANGILLSLLLFKFQLHAPVILLSSLGLFEVFEDPLFQIYILGRPSEGSLRRPFRKKRLFFLFY